jgi:hypothetical protein
MLSVVSYVLKYGYVWKKRAYTHAAGTLVFPQRGCLRVLDNAAAARRTKTGEDWRCAANIMYGRQRLFTVGREFTRPCR